MKTLILVLLIFSYICISSCNENRTESPVNSKDKCLPVDIIKDLGGFFDPLVKVLYTTEEDKDNILKKLNSKKLNDSEYVMPWKTISGNPMQINFQVVPKVQGLIFLYVNEYQKSIADHLAITDASRAEFVEAFVDNNGTFARIYREARCDTVTQESLMPCTEIIRTLESINEIDYYPLGHFSLDSVFFRTRIYFKTEPTGIYSTTEQKTIKNCLKGGNDYCVEELVITSIRNNYADKNCSQLLDIKPTYGYSCR